MGTLLERSCSVVVLEAGRRAGRPALEA